MAAGLFLKLFGGNCDYRLHTSEAVGRTKTQSLFQNLKRSVHDSQFKNPKRALRHMAERFMSELDNETDELKRQSLADKCVAIIGVEIDAFYDSLDCNNEITQDQMFSKLKLLIPHTSNPLITDTLYYTRQANMNAFHGNIEHAENMLIKARTSAFNIEHCPELTNMLYVEVYVKLWEFEINPTQSNLNSLMMWGRIGLESIETENTSAKRFWGRMFLLRMVFALLGIGNRANIIKNYCVTPQCLHEAQTLLAVVDKYWRGIEVRREMFYCVAKARVNEQLKRFDEAKLYIDRAKLLAVQGRFLEKIPFIDEFAGMINENLLFSDQIFSEDFNLSSMSIQDSCVQNITVTSAVDVEQTSIKHPMRTLQSNNQRQSDRETQPQFRKRNSQRIVDKAKHVSDSSKTCQHGYACTDAQTKLGKPIPTESSDEYLDKGAQCETIQRMSNYVSDGNHGHQRQDVHSEMKCLKSVSYLPCNSETSGLNISFLRDGNVLYNKYRGPSRKEFALITSNHESHESRNLEGGFEALKLSGGNLVLCSDSCEITNSSSTTYLSNDSITELKDVAAPQECDTCIFVQEQTEENLNCPLLCKCHAGVHFGSVALFEQRSDGDGASGDCKSVQPIEANIKAETTDTLFKADNEINTSDLKDNEIDSDMDDEALFGDGI